MAELDPTPLVIGLGNGELVGVTSGLRLCGLQTLGSPSVAIAALGGELYATSTNGVVAHGDRRSEPLGSEPVGMVPFVLRDDAGERTVLAVALARATVSFVDPTSLEPVSALVREPFTPTGIAVADGTLVLSTWEGSLLCADLAADKLWAYSAMPSARGASRAHLRGVTAVGPHAIGFGDAAIVAIWLAASPDTSPKIVPLGASPPAAVLAWGARALVVTQAGELFAVDPASGASRRVDGAVTPSARGAALVPRDGLAVLGVDSLGLYRLTREPAPRATEEREIRLGTSPGVMLATRTA